MAQPKHSIHVDFAKKQVEHVLDYRGSQNLPERPLLLDCDFCNRPSDRLWCRRVSQFEAEMWPGHKFLFEGGNWNACVFCNPMVYRRDVPLLLARVLIVNVEARKAPAVGFERLYNAVFAAMDEAPAVQWNAGEVFPVEIPQASTPT